MDSGLAMGPAEGWSEALIIADWPVAGSVFPEAAAEFEQLQELVRRIRNVRAEQNVEPAKLIPATIAAGKQAAFLNLQADVLALGPWTAYLPLAGMVDLKAEQERLSADEKKLAQEITRLTGLLNSPFAERAPADVVAKEREKLTQLVASHTEVSQRLRALTSGS